MAQSKFTKVPSMKDILVFLNGLVDDIGSHSHPNMGGATTTSTGKAGFVPAPATGANNRYLRSDGTWSVPPDHNTTYGVVSQSAAGLVPQANGAKNNVLTGLGAWADISTLVSASTTGGIVAQSLGQNGYVKFANGLILQWGSCAGTLERVITLPLPFTATDYIAVVGAERHKGSVYQILITQKTTTQIALYSHDTSTPVTKTFIAIGW